MTRRQRNAGSTPTITEANELMPAIKKLLVLSMLLSCVLLGLNVARSAAGVETRREISSFNGASSDAGKFEDVKRLDINQSTGTIYVIDARGNFNSAVVDKFNANGEAEDFSALGSSTLTGAAVTPPVGLQLEYESDIAVDNSPTATNGRFYLFTQGGNAFYAFAPSGEFLYKTTVGVGEAKACGIAVDNSGNVWIGEGVLNKVTQYSSAGVPTGKTIATKHEACSLAFDSANNLYVGGRGWEPLLVQEEGLIEKYNSSGVFQAQFSREKYTDITVDRANGDVLAADDHQNTVREFSSSGQLAASYIRTGGLGIGINEGTGHVYVSSENTQEIHVFGPRVPLPRVTTQVATSVEPLTATLNGTVEPEGHEITGCYFQYVADSDYESSGGWFSPGVHTAPCVPGSMPDSGATSVSADITRPKTTLDNTEAFHFRIVAENSNGPAFGFERVVGFGITDFDGEVLKANHEPDTQAGAHPFLATQPWHINKFFGPSGQLGTSESIRNVTVDLPAGFVGNPQALPTCAIADFAVNPGQLCSRESVVGVVRLQTVGQEPPFNIGVDENGNPTIPGNPSTLSFPIYNLDAPQGTVGLLGFSVLNFPNYVSVRVRTGTDYGLTFEAVNAVQSILIPLNGAIFDVWGVPGDPAHDALRAVEGTPAFSHPAPYKGTPTAFLTLPTSCIGPVESRIRVQTWEGDEDRASALSHDNTKPVPNPIGTEGCNTLDFSPTLEARPTTNVADSPSGLSVDLHVPQSDITNPASTAEAHLKTAVVKLPEGLVINPSVANGLGTCPSADVGLTSAPGATPVTYTPDAAHCPEPSRIGTVEIDTPLLDHPLPGGVFVATPYDNPFKSLLAIYVMVRDPQTGLVIKLAGRIDRDPATGRLTAVFDENPQLPFGDLKLNINGGSLGPLRTPETCGVYSTTSSLTPWSAPDSGPPATPSDSYGIEQGAVGGTCPSSSKERPNTPSFDAGTEAPLAGAKSPLVVNLRREDGSQQFSAVTIAAPPGLIGKLAGIPYCSDAALATAATKTGAEEKASPSCPSASEVGSVTAAAGAGPAPYYAPGKAFLAGPYKGAPLSLAVITPATAGPFDLGTIVVRAALFIDPRTAQITAAADPIPAILQGIPLDVRTVQIKLDRPEFISNPTSCDPMSFGGQLLSTLGQAASLSSRFQLGECGRLGFEPNLSLTLKGGTARSKHPALTAVLKTRPGDANLSNISVALPHSEFLDQAHIGTVCTRVQFAASHCPAAAAYGRATVTTPLLDYPLTGPVYLRSSDNSLPDLVPDLRGPANQPIKLEADGRIDSVKGGIRNTFDYVPDAPLSKVVLSFEGGSKGLLQNSTDICRKTFRATVRFGAHNGLRTVAHPALRANCGSKAKKHRHRPSHRRRANRRAAS